MIEIPIWLLVILSVLAFPIAVIIIFLLFITIIGAILALMDLLIGTHEDFIHNGSEEE